MATANGYRDLVLTFHQVHTRAFELSGLRTGSLRDQMLRATLLVERIAEGPFLETHKRLLIVGAGAAGVAAALRASELGIDCMLLEREPWAFGAQNDSSRIVDPTEYDWPQPHWRRGRFALRPPEQDLPLDFTRGTAEVLSRRWQQFFAHWVLGARGMGLPVGAIDLRHRRDLVALAGPGLNFECWARQDDPAWRHKECDIEIREDAVEMRYADPVRPQESFGAVLSCIGFGSETVSVPITGASIPYTGPRFWQRDSLDERTLGLPNPDGLVRILVSGGGDGAMQDIQRALTRKCGRDLYDSLLKVDPQFEQKINLARALAADDEGRRAHAWRAPGRGVARALRRWHLVYAQIARSIWRRWTPAQRQALREQVLRESVTIHLFWAVGSGTPGYAFGLNRLLTYLVLLMHQEHTGRPFSGSNPKSWGGDRPIVMQGHRVTRIEPIGHTCKDHQSCNGHGHRVFCQGQGSREHLLGEFEIVVIRHGAAPRPLIASPLVAEQFVPFRFPA